MIIGALCGLGSVPSGAAVAESDWVEVPHGRPANQDSVFADAWTTGDEVWAVGERGYTLPESSDRHNWAQRCVAGVCSPTHPHDFESPPYTLNQLLSISGTSNHDVWAVGSARMPDGVEGATTHHFDGTGWTVVPNPVTRGRLNGVSAAATNDVWTVGLDGPAPDDVILRWDGSTWSRMPFELNGPCAPSWLYDVDATGRWPLVVGLCENERSPQSRAMVASYRNGAWHRMHVAGISSDDYVFHVSWVGKQAWITGQQVENRYPLAARWKKGDGWHAVDTGDWEADFESVAGIRANDVWIVGSTGCCTPLALHWDGNTLAPEDVGADGSFYGVAVSPDGTVWAVGDEPVGLDRAQSLIMKRDPG